MNNRELDLLIAEKFFNLSLFDVGSRESIPVAAAQVLGNMLKYSSIPKFSTEMSSAWKIVEKIRDDNFSIEENGTHWKARFGSHWAGSLEAPRAICLAALRSIGIEYE